MKKNLMNAALMLALVSFSTVSFAQNVTQRANNEQKRINNGVKSGELTPRETKKLEKREAKVQTEIAVDKAKGGITPSERNKINRQENKNSRVIYNDKHNGAVKPH